MKDFHSMFTCARTKCRYITVYYVRYHFTTHWFRFTFSNSAGLFLTLFMLGLLTFAFYYKQ